MQFPAVMCTAGAMFMIGLSGKDEPGETSPVSWGASGMLLPVAITIAVSENETPAMIFGCICGALCDIGFDTHIGFYTIALTLLCFAFGYTARNFFVTNFVNAMVIGTVTITVLLILHFLIFCTGKDIPNAGGHFVRHYLIKILYTFVGSSISTKKLSTAIIKTITRYLLNIFLKK